MSAALDLTWWELVLGGVLGGGVGGTLGAWLSARWREHEVRRLIERMDCWGHRLHAGHEQLGYSAGEPALDPQMIALLEELDRRGAADEPHPMRRRDDVRRELPDGVPDELADGPGGQVRA